MHIKNVGLDMNAWGDVDGNGISISNSSTIHARTNIVKKNSDRLNGNYLIAVGSKSARFRRRHKNRIILVALLVLIFILAIALIVVSIFYSMERGRKICQSKQCVRSAANLVLAMDSSVDPCDDFYQYSCGNWAEDHLKPEYMTSYNLFSMKEERIGRKIKEILTKNSTDDEPLPIQQARDMYKACLDKDSIKSLGMKPVLDLMKDAGLNGLPNGFNLTKSGQSISDWIEIIVKLKKKTELDVLIGFDILYDFSNTSAKILTFGQPTSSMLFPGYKKINEALKLVKLNKYETADDEVGEEDDKPKDDEMMVLYAELMKTASKLMIDSVPQNERLNKSEKFINDTIEANLLDYVNLYGELYAVFSVDAAHNSDEDDIIYVTADDLQKQTYTVLRNYSLPAIDIWKTYILKMFNGTNITIDFKTDRIMASKREMDMEQQLLAIVQNNTLTKLETFMWFQLLENCIPFTAVTMTEAYNQFITKVVGSESRTPRSTYCASNINDVMGMAIGYAVVSLDNEKSTISRAVTMLDNIKRSLEDMIVNSDWMDIPNKVTTVEKIHNMKSLVGYPDWLFKPGSLEKYYEGLAVETDTFLKNQITISELSFREKLNKFREPHVNDWTTVPTETNAFHTYPANTITIPYAMLQYPFYDLGLEALNYGALGAVLGHELTHGIDNIGRTYDKDGNKKKWWSNSTINTYAERAQCLRKQYSEFYISEVDEYVDGNLTLDENIADNGGLTAAMLAYWSIKNDEKLPGLSHLSSEQLFFLSHGNLWCGIMTTPSLRYSLKDNHAPNHLRINGNMQNTPEFARVWNCPVDSNMNPSRKKCIMF